MSLRRFAAPKSSARIALFDPHDDTAKQLAGLDFKKVNAGDDLSGFEVLIIGKERSPKMGQGLI